ncbi:MAG: bifunctional riboflavin kinase/FAD synthetase [Bacteroidales bacterium]|jgi:riboflavin kinase/FMN adenylyltransferase|nr:bifunctional riboflavin kinase/FAD synthetase [Bacteroidales bacterium]
MEIHNGYEGFTLVRPVVTIGIFDGVHRGHRILLDTLVKNASSAGADSVVITFDPHPRMVLEKGSSNLHFLSTLDEKKTLLAKARVGHLVIIPFTLSFSRMSACDFVSSILAEKLKTRHLIMGHDHHFGSGREGNYSTVNQCAAALGFDVVQLKGLRSREGIISSSMIREALIKGDLDNANKWLGYAYSLTGEVIEGRKLGRKLGFPTANLKPVDKYKLIPANGVYAVEVKTGGETLPGMLSIGTNPTVSANPGKRSVEVHIFDFDRDIYGHRAEVLFRYRLRDEIRFDNVVKLTQQMERDRKIALRLLSE